MADDAEGPLRRALGGCKRRAKPGQPGHPPAHASCSPSNWAPLASSTAHRLLYVLRTVQSPVQRSEFASVHLYISMWPAPRQHGPTLTVRVLVILQSAKSGDCTSPIPTQVGESESNVVDWRLYLLSPCTALCMRILPPLNKLHGLPDRSP